MIGQANLWWIRQILVTSIFFSANAASASFIYSFAGAGPLGAPFTSIHGSFEVANSVPANMGSLGPGAVANISHLVQSFSFSNGFESFTEASSSFLVGLSTGPDGSIYNWVIFAQSLSGGLEAVTDSVVNEDRAWIGSDFDTALTKTIVNNPWSAGQWSVSERPAVVPEPSAAITFSLGCLLIGCARQRV